MRWLLPVIALICSAASAEGASFDCKKASTPDEKAVCSDPELSDLDSLMARAYGEAKTVSNDADLRQSARDVMADRHACGSDRACILSTYVAGLRAYGNYGIQTSVPATISAMSIAKDEAPASKTLPDKVGRCATTTVDSVHPRLGNEEDNGTFSDEDFDAGTGIDYTSEGYQVSYSREEALIQSKPGDEVIMCLISIPHRCPPGDDRGREYLSTNKRTGQTWILPDSQHACGGA